jgi:F-type H+-transporting ATPase subunit gamma
MANLKLIRQRIRSVKATHKITSAMRLVAAAKVRRAQMRVQAGRPFMEAIKRVLRDAVADVSPVDLQEIPLLQRRPITKKVALIVFSSDRGLCGSYNSNVLRETMNRIKVLQDDGIEVALILIGLKAAGFFRSVKVEKLKAFTNLPAIPTVEEAKLIAETATDFFLNGTVDAVEIIATHFVSMLNSRIDLIRYLPVELPEPGSRAGIAPQKLFEPSVLEVISKELLPKYVHNLIYQSLLEASASELAARMNAMTNASNNARDLIANLTLVYNKARQASITQELLEIVGGAEALKG